MAGRAIAEAARRVMTALRILFPRILLSVPLSLGLRVENHFVRIVTPG
jgi:hypothetical protein